MSYRITGLEPNMFSDLFGLDSDALAAKGVERHVVTSRPGAPCRISLEDAAIGESVLLLSFEHQPATTPYRRSGPIFVREGCVGRYEAVDRVPPALAIRTLSVRGFDRRGNILDANLVEGTALADVISRQFANPEIAYLQAHYAKRGCFAATIDRA